MLASRVQRSIFQRKRHAQTPTFQLEQKACAHSEVLCLTESWQSDWQSGKPLTFQTDRAKFGNEVQCRDPAIDEFSRP
jgi:hypothetical protein